MKAVRYIFYSRTLFDFIIRIPNTKVSLFKLSLIRQKVPVRKVYPTNIRFERGRHPPPFLVVQNRLDVECVERLQSSARRLLFDEVF